MSEHGWVYNQLFTNWKKFEITYITALILLQLIVYAIEPQNLFFLRNYSMFGDDLHSVDQSRLRLVRDGYCLRNFATDRLVYVGKRSGDEVF